MEKGNKIMLALGLAFILAGGVVFFESKSFQKNATPTTGQVVHVLGTSYTIQYSTHDGTTKTIKGSGKTHGYREGNTIKVWYSNDNPDRARYTDRRKIARTLTIVGAMSLLLGLYPLFIRKSRR